MIWLVLILFTVVKILALVALTVHLWGDWWMIAALVVVWLIDVRWTYNGRSFKI